MEDLPTDYDVIVIGTGMTGAIVAAALSRVGKAVLHLDENDYYGEQWASFNLETLNLWLESVQSVEIIKNKEDKHLLTENEIFIPAEKRQQVSHAEQHWFCCDKIDDTNSVAVPSTANEDSMDLTAENSSSGRGNKTEQELMSSLDLNEKSDVDEVNWTPQKFKDEYRKFNIDISPRMLYSRGALVELLITSNIARYAEFKSVSRVLTWRQGRLEVVPCSRADVFSTKHVSVVQKRMLVKILTSFADSSESSDEFRGFEEKTFMEYLKYKKLDDQLVHYIVYAIAMGSAATLCLEGVAKCRKFLQSLGRYGNTPFITPLYGAGELPQCFCRLCAVFGGVYHLNRSVDGFILNGDDCVGIVSNGQRLNTKQVVVTSSLCPPQYLQLHKKRPPIFRSAYITNKSVAPSSKEEITLLQFPPQSAEGSPITIIEMGASCQVCPAGLYLVHVTSQGESCSTDSHDQFRQVRDSLFRKEKNDEDSRPDILWSLSWQMDPGSCCSNADCPPNFKIYSGPDADIDYDLSVSKACEIFKELCPDEEFLPRAPDPDEILLEPAVGGQEEECASTSTECVAPDAVDGTKIVKNEEVNIAINASIGMEREQDDEKVSYQQENSVTDEVN